MQQITIKSIEVKEGQSDRGPWKNYIITGEDNTKANTFSPTASSLKVGDIIEADIELKGKYANIKDFKVLTQSKPQVALAESNPPKTNGFEKNTTSIERQVSLKAAIELTIASANEKNLLNAIVVNETLYVAETLFQWLHNDIILPPERTEVHTAPESHEDKLGQASEGNSKETIDPLKPGAFKDITDLVAYAKSKGLTTTFIKNVTHTDDLRTIKDLDVAAKVLFGGNK